MAGEVPSADPSSDSLIGTTLAHRYLIEHRLGEGAMGAVYKARHVKVGRPFAVKVLHAHLLVDAKILQRFEREAELAGRLHHPNVIGVVDVGETNGMRYMVMDYAEGPDLATLMSEAPMPPQRIIHICRQLLEGLFHAHEAGLIHRDFKPENVIIERDTHGAEVPRIVDFGIAILREGGESSDGLGRLTTNGLVLGTPHYMAPEQAVADPIDHRIDLFAVGIIIYEMLSGKLPFDGTGAEVARANLLLDPPPISERVPDLAVDPLLEAFARRMMAKKRSQRPATAKAARDLLDLIGSDRAAAAVALGLPVERARTPQNTQPLAPARDLSHPGTFPPPLREAIATPPQAPPMQTKVADFVGERAVITEPLEPSRKRRTPLIIAAISGIVVIGVAALALRSGKHAEPIAAATPPMPIATPADAAIVAEATPDASPPDAAGAPIAAIPDIKPTPKPKPIATRHDHVAPKIESRSPSVTAPVMPTAPVAAKPVDVGMLVAQFQSVGAELKALEQAKGADVASELQARYRLILINDAMSSQAKRDQTTSILTKLHQEIAIRRAR